MSFESAIDDYIQKAAERERGRIDGSGFIDTWPTSDDPDYMEGFRKGRKELSNGVVVLFERSKRTAR